MKKIKSLVSGLLALVVLAGSLMFTPLAQADDGTHIQISPAKERIKLEPGQQYDGSFVVNNIGNGNFDFNVYIAPFSVSDDCTENYEKDSDWTQLTSWVKFDQSEYKGVQAGTGRTVNYHINTPMDIPRGDQYAVIFAETISYGATINIAQRVGYKIYADLGGETRQAGEMVSVEQNGLYFDPPIGAVSKVSNTGNVDFALNHTMIVKDVFGKEIAKETASADVLPASCRAVTLVWKDTPALGLFQVTNQVNFLNQEQFSDTSWVLVIPIYIAAIFGLVLILLIIALIMLIAKKRRTRRSML